MNNFETRYSVIGSSALQPGKHDTACSKECIIDFPASFEDDSKESAVSPQASLSPLHAMGTRVKRLLYIDEIRGGTLQGKSFDKVKPWQTALAGSFFFLVALAFIFIGQ